MALALFTGVPSAGALEGDAGPTGPGSTAGDVASALSEFRSGLAARAGTDPDAADGLVDFDHLQPEQLEALGQYLTGELALNLVDQAGDPQSADTTVATDGDFRWESEPVTTVASGPAVRATTYNVHATGDATFTFAGILISKTRVWADYVTGSGVVKSITNYGCQVLNNYDVFSTITSSKAGQSLSGGAATFLCTVVVKRGVPTPWGSLSWSTASGLQYLGVNGPGVTGTGWR